MSGQESLKEGRLDRRLSIAPMMDWTDRHDRYFLRLISPHCLLYTEMITTHALVHGNRDYLLRFNAAELPLALQLGGCNPVDLALCAKIAEDKGFSEVNLNVGCPSDRVQHARFGACLMAEPGLVAECVAQMQQAAALPVTVKTRIGIDDQDSYEHLTQFISSIAATGCSVFIIHARKAWLQGLSPRQNREIPPLRYDVVERLKKDFPQLTIILNGGIKTLDAVKEHLTKFDGVMLGREAYHNPYFLASIEQEVFNNDDVLSREETVSALIPYIRDCLTGGNRLHSITRHILGLFKGEQGAAHWRRYLSQHANLPAADVKVLEEALRMMQK